MKNEVNIRINVFISNCFIGVNVGDTMIGVTSSVIVFVIFLLVGGSDLGVLVVVEKDEISAGGRNFGGLGNSALRRIESPCPLWKVTIYKSTLIRKIK